MFFTISLLFICYQWKLKIPKQFSKIIYVTCQLYVMMYRIVALVSRYVSCLKKMYRCSPNIAKEKPRDGLESYPGRHLNQEITRHDFNNWMHIQT